MLIGASSAPLPKAKETPKRVSFKTDEAPDPEELEQHQGHHGNNGDGGAEEEDQEEGRATPERKGSRNQDPDVRLFLPVFACICHLVYVSFPAIPRRGRDASQLLHLGAGKVRLQQEHGAHAQRHRRAGGLQVHFLKV